MLNNMVVKPAAFNRSFQQG